jgi:hypothetical protein
MPEYSPPVTRGEEPKMAEELAAIPHEPLLPIEKKLILWSLAAGVLLLAILVWVSTTFFPVDPSTR